MTREVERKFIVVNNSWKQCEASRPAEKMVQGYITKSDDTLARVRLIFDPETGNPQRAELAIKSKRKFTDGAIDREEMNYPIPVEDAQRMLENDICHYSVHKTRHHVMHQGREWSIDEFTDPKYMGLTIAEVEFNPGENPHDLKDMPSFVSVRGTRTEVTQDGRFSTRALADPENDITLPVTKARGKVIWAAVEPQLSLKDDEHARLAYRLLKAHVRRILLPVEKVKPSKLTDAQRELLAHDAGSTRMDNEIYRAVVPHLGQKSQITRGVSL